MPGSDPLGVTAVAALLQHNTSGIISRAGEGMSTPKGLEGHRYSTYNGVIELAIMQQVVEADGGDFSQVELIPYTLEDEAGALKEGLTDAIWVYYGWGGINAQVEGLDFDYFYFKDIDPVFDYYTPVIIANNDFLAEDPDTAKAFLSAVAQGYEYAIDHPEEAAQILMDGDDYRRPGRHGGPDRGQPEVDGRPVQGRGGTVGLHRPGAVERLLQLAERKGPGGHSHPREHRVFQ